MNTLTYTAHFRAILRAHLDAEPGRRIRLAAHLGVPKQTVTNWLRDRHPSHEQTLAVLAWLPAKCRRAILSGDPARQIPLGAESLS